MATRQELLENIARAIEGLAWKDEVTGEPYRWENFLSYERYFVVKPLTQVIDAEHMWTHFPHGEKVNLAQAAHAVAQALPLANIPADAVVVHTVFAHGEDPARVAFRNALYDYFHFEDELRYARAVL